MTERSERPGCLGAAEALVTRLHAEAVENFLSENGLAPTDIDVIGFHGQTVVHRPDQKMSVQIGDGRALSRRLGIKVVSDLRHADIEAGGQGAPLVPVFHRRWPGLGLQPTASASSISGRGQRHPDRPRRAGSSPSIPGRATR